MDTLTVTRSAVVHDRTPAMFPAITTAGDDLLVSFSTVPDGWPGGRVGVIRSPDGGLTWGEPLWIAGPGDNSDAALSAVSLAPTSSGRLLLPYNTVRWTGSGVDGRHVRVAMANSVDNGRSWQHETAIRGRFAGPCVYGTIIEAPGSRLLWPVWGQRTKTERWRSTVFISSDDGLNFAPLATIGYDPQARMTGRYAHPRVSGVDPTGQPSLAATTDPDFRPHAANDGFNETSILLLPDGEILAILRQQGVGGDNTLQLFESRSTDAGTSWTPPRPLGISGMSPSLHLVNGTTPVLAYRRHTPEGSGIGAGVEVRVGDRNAETWSAPITLTDPHGRQPTAEYQTGYPAMVDAGPDSLLAVFYSFRPGHGRYLAANWIAIDHPSSPSAHDVQPPHTADSVTRTSSLTNRSDSKTVPPHQIAIPPAGISITVSAHPDT